MRSVPAPTRRSCISMAVPLGWTPTIWTRSNCHRRFHSSEADRVINKKMDRILIWSIFLIQKLFTCSMRVSSGRCNNDGNGYAFVHHVQINSYTEFPGALLQVTVTL